MSKKKNPWTHKYCDELIKEFKDNTSYFDFSMTLNDMYAMLRDRMHFGEAESIVIMASLIKAGAKFMDDSWD